MSEELPQGQQGAMHHLHHPREACESPLGLLKQAIVPLHPVAGLTLLTSAIGQSDWTPITTKDGFLTLSFPADRAAPIVTVLDGHPHALSFLGNVQSVPVTCLGVDDFGQSGDVEDLYRHFGIDVDTIVGAALDLLP